MNTITLFLTRIITAIAALPELLENHTRKLKTQTEAGEVSVSYILIVLAAVAIAGIVIAAVTSYVRTKTGELK